MESGVDSRRTGGSVTHCFCNGTPPHPSYSRSVCGEFIIEVIHKPPCKHLMQGSERNDEVPLQSTFIHKPVLMGANDSGFSGAAAFEKRFEQFYLQLSEGKTGGMVACVDEMKRIVESMRRGDRSSEHAAAETSSGVTVYDEMLQDCRRKAGEATLDRLRKLCQRLVRPGAVDEVDELEGEGMAEEETIVVSYHAALLGKAESAANIYGGFLRKRLKKANDSTVKNLSSTRALYRLNLASGGGGGASAGGGRSDTGVVPDGTAATAFTADPHPHLTALATVLGEGSKLMARLAESSLGQGVEEPVVQLLHNDSKAQAVKVLEWFQRDADLPKWQTQVSGGTAEARDSTESRRASPTPSSGNGREAIGGGVCNDMKTSGGGASAAGSGRSSFDARGVDFVIDEMALACQYCQRYLDFVADDLGLREEPTSDFFVQVRVIEGAYVQLEVAYCLRSVEEAMRIAEPIEVQDGTYVSSMVEDASFLVHKSLRRSVSTRSEQAIMAVCNRVTEILDPHAPEPSFYGGLATEADHRVPVEAEIGGDHHEHDHERQPDDFSTALAKALDEAADAELRGEDAVTVAATRSDGRNTSARFGGVEGAMVGINSVHVALSSVSAIQDALDRFLESSNPLVRLMMDEVARILRAYKDLRDSRLNDLLLVLYPPISTALANAFGSSSYALGPTEYEFRSSNLPGAQRVLNAATQALVGGEEGTVGCSKGIGAGEGGSCCRTALLQEPFEELVRRLACRVSAAIEAAVRSKRGKRVGGSGGADTAPVSGGSPATGAGFTEWGALLLRKEVRTLQQGLAALMETDSLNSEFAGTNELVRLLNFERPSDAVEYRPPPVPRRPGGSTESGSRGKNHGLSSEGVKEVLRLRVDFQGDAIDALNLK